MESKIALNLIERPTLKGKEQGEPETLALDEMDIIHLSLLW